jgi:hypothetical protein
LLQGKAPLGAMPCVRRRVVQALLYQVIDGNDPDFIAPPSAAYGAAALSQPKLCRVVKRLILSPAVPMLYIPAG